MNNPMSQNLRGLADFFRNIGASLLAIGGFLTGIVAVIQLLRNENSVTGLVLLAIALSSVWLTCFYVVYKKSPRDKTAGFKSRSTQSFYSFEKPKRIIALAGVFMLPVLYAAGYFVIRNRRNISSDKIIILVANFESLDGQNYGVTEKILEQLRFETEHYSDVHVQALKTAVTAQEGRDHARTLAGDNNASIFLWGWYRKTEENVLITVHVEVLKKPADLRLKRETQESIRPAKELESFQLQTRLSNEMTYLTLLTIGLARMESGKHQDAISLFTQAIQLAAAPETLIDPANVFYFRGYSHLATRSFKNAIADFTESLRITPKNFCTACAYANRGIASFELFDFDSALKDFLESRKHDAAPAGIHHNIGLTYQRKGDLDNAVQAFTEAVNRDPTFVDSYGHLADLFFEGKQFEQAIESMNRVLSVEPDNWKMLNNRGIAFIKLGNYSLGIDDLNRAKLIRPEIDPDENRNSLIDKQLFLTEMAKYNQLLRSDANSAAAYVSRATLFNSVTDYERARADLDKAIAINAELAEAYHQRGKALEKLELKNEAIADFDKFLGLATDERARADAKEHLGRLGVSR